MLIWNWLMDLWFGPVRPEQKVETLVSGTVEPVKEVDRVVVVTPSKKSTKKPKAIIEGDAKLLYTNDDEKKKLITPKDNKPKKGK